MIEKMYLLWCYSQHEPITIGSGFTMQGGTIRTELKGMYESEEEAKYYCDELNKVNKYPHVKYYVDKFYCNTRFYFGDANGNYPVALYYKPNEK
jgi:hypothetical protein